MKTIKIIKQAINQNEIDKCIQLLTKEHKTSTAIFTASNFNTDQIYNYINPLIEKAAKNYPYTFYATDVESNKTVGTISGLPLFDENGYSNVFGQYQKHNIVTENPIKETCKNEMLKFIDEGRFDMKKHKYLKGLNVAIDSEFQGKGIYLELYNALVNKAKENGFDKMYCQMLGLRTQRFADLYHAEILSKVYLRDIVYKDEKVFQNYVNVSKENYETFLTFVMFDL